MRWLSIKTFFTSGSFVYNTTLAVVAWFGLGFMANVYSLLVETNGQVQNNYLIFKYVYIHTVEQVNLYKQYPQHYFDSNHYGILFSILIAPFAKMPDKLGVIIWVLLNNVLLFYAIRKLPIAKAFQNAILLCSTHELMNASAYVQTNAAIAACIILAYVFVTEKKEIWALLFIAIATFVKLYGIVGLAFFFISERKLSFIAWGLFWCIICFIAPLLITSWQFNLQSYADWYASLTEKAAKNTNLQVADSIYQDISVMGMVRRIMGFTNVKDVYILLPALLLFALQFIHVKKYIQHTAYGLLLLCSVLLFTVIFSNGAESPTYIICFPACCLWWVIQPSSKTANGLFVFCLLLTSFSYSDIFTPYVRENIIRPYSLKALPCFVLWMVIVWQMVSKKFETCLLHPPIANTN